MQTLLKHSSDLTQIILLRYVSDVQLQCIISVLRKQCQNLLDYLQIELIINYSIMLKACNPSTKIDNFFLNTYILCYKTILWLKAKIMLYLFSKKYNPTLYFVCLQMWYNKYNNRNNFTIEILSSNLSSVKQTRQDSKNINKFIRTKVHRVQCHIADTKLKSFFKSLWS